METSQCSAENFKFKFRITGLQDGIMESQDYSDMENAVSMVAIGYIPQDITGDGVVESADYTILENNVSSVIFVTRP